MRKWILLIILLIVIAAILYLAYDRAHKLFVGGDSSGAYINSGNDADITEEILEMFEVWKRESIIPRELYEGKPPTLETVHHALSFYNHGGYYPASDAPITMGDAEDPLPYMREGVFNGTKVQFLQIPYCVSRDSKFHHKYAAAGNKLMLKHFKNGQPIYLSFAGNSGGKEAPMFAAMSPLFNGTRDDLWYVKKGNIGSGSGIGDGDGSGDESILTPQKPRVKPGLYYSESAGKPIKCSKKILRPSRIEVIIGGNGSAGEIITIAMKTLQKTPGMPPVKLYGRNTAGGTTMIGWCKLSHGGGAEYPVGLMTDFEGADYSRGISPDEEIPNPFAD